MADNTHYTSPSELELQKKWEQNKEVSPAGLIALFEPLFQIKDSLAVEMFVATLISLTERGIVDLNLLEEKRALGLGSSSELLVCQNKEIPSDALGRRIAALTSRVNAKVRNILLSCWLKNCPNPHKEAETWVTEELVAQGYMIKVEEKKRFRTKMNYKPIPESTSIFQSRAQDLKNQMIQYQKLNPKKYKKLRYEINIGLDLQTSYPV